MQIEEKAAVGKEMPSIVFGCGLYAPTR